MAGCFSRRDEFAPEPTVVVDRPVGSSVERPMVRGRVFSCTICGRSFPSFQALGGHQTSHRRERAEHNRRRRELLLAAEHRRHMYDDQQWQRAGVQSRYYGGGDGGPPVDNQLHLMIADMVASAEAAVTPRTGARSLSAAEDHLYARGSAAGFDGSARMIEMQRRPFAEGPVCPPDEVRRTVRNIILRAGFAGLVFSAGALYKQLKLVCEHDPCHWACRYFLYATFIVSLLLILIAKICM